MNLTPRVLRAVAIAGLSAAAPLVAAMPAHAGAGVPQGPAAATADMPPCEDGRGCDGADVLSMRKAGGDHGDYAPGPGADIIAI